MTTRNTQDRSVELIACGYLPQLADNEAGALAQTVNGCKATWGGFAGGWGIELEDVYPYPEMVIQVTKGPGSEVGGSASDVGLGSIESGLTGKFSIHMQRIEVIAADNVAVTNFSIPLYFTVWKRYLKT